jgi:hypothetical protein
MIEDIYTPHLAAEVFERLQDLGRIPRAHANRHDVGHFPVVCIAARPGQPGHRFTNQHRAGNLAGQVGQVRQSRACIGINHSRNYTYLTCGRNY